MGQLSQGVNMNILRLLALVLGLAHGAAGWAAGPSPLKVGLLPTLSPRALLTNYQPVRTHLERELKRPVEMSTAVDFSAFHRATMAGDYDLVLTAPHLARLAQIEGKFKPLTTYATTNRAVFIMAKDRPVRSVAEVRGKGVAVFDHHAMVVLQGLRWLSEHGLKANLDFKLLEPHSHNSVAHSVLSGESVLGITAPAGIKQWTDEYREKLDVYAELPEQIAVTWVAHPRLAAKSVQQIRTALLRLSDSPEGKQFFEKTGYKGMREISDKEMRTLDGYAKEISVLLREQP